LEWKKKKRRRREKGVNGTVKGKKPISEEGKSSISSWGSSNSCGKQIVIVLGKDAVKKEAISEFGGG